MSRTHKESSKEIKESLEKIKLENTVFKIQILLKIYLACILGEFVYNTFFDKKEDYGTNSEDNHIGYDSEDFYYDDTDWYLEERFNA